MKDTTLIILAALGAAVLYLVLRQRQTSDAPMINTYQYARPTAASGGGGGGLGGLGGLFN